MSAPAPRLAPAEPSLLVTASPHLAGPDRTPVIMWSVAASLLPVVAAAAYYFGLSALLVVGTSTVAALLTERLFAPRFAVRDGSAAICGVLLGLTLPPGVPLWMAAVGAAFAIGLGKLVYGGLGQNIFNPALLGRAFLQAAFPVAMTTFTPPTASFFSFAGDNLALPLMQAAAVDVVTGATPLSVMKFEHTSTDTWALFVGNTMGSLGETSAVLILLCGAYLALRNYLNWRVPVGILLTVAALSGALYLVDPKIYPTPLFALFSGGLVLGAVYMATDPVTSPLTHKGAWLFAAGIGVLVVVIRSWGGLTEGVMYAILLMNALVPFINRVTGPRPFGARVRGKA